MPAGTNSFDHSGSNAFVHSGFNARGSGFNLYVSIAGGLPSSGLHRISDSGVIWSTGISFDPDIARDAAGNVAMSGFTNSSFSVSAFSVYSPFGSLKFSRSVSSSSGALNHVAMDSVGNVYSGGIFFDGGTFQGRIRKYDSVGTLLWERNHAGGAVGVDPAGTIVVVSKTREASSLDAATAIWILSASNGDILKKITYNDIGQSSQAQLQAVAVDSSGVGYVGRIEAIFPIQPVSYVYAVNVANGLLWRAPSTIPQVARRGVMVAGGAVYVSAGAQESQGVVYKLNSAGALQWSTPTPPPAHGPTAMTSDGRLFAAGPFTTGPTVNELNPSTGAVIGTTAFPLFSGFTEMLPA